MRVDEGTGHALPSPTWGVQLQLSEVPLTAVVRARKVAHCAAVCTLQAEPPTAGAADGLMPLAARVKAAAAVLPNHAATLDAFRASDAPPLCVAQMVGAAAVEIRMRSGAAPACILSRRAVSVSFRGRRRVGRLWRCVVWAGGPGRFLFVLRFSFLSNNARGWRSAHSFLFFPFDCPAVNVWYTLLMMTSLPHLASNSLMPPSFFISAHTRMYLVLLVATARRRRPG